MDTLRIVRKTDTDALDTVPLKGLETLLPPMVALGLHAFVENESGCRRS